MLDRNKVEKLLKKYNLDEELSKKIFQDLIDNYDKLLVTNDVKQYLIYIGYEECNKQLPENLIKIKDKLFFTTEEDEKVRYSYQKEYFIQPYFLTNNVIYNILKRSLDIHSSIKIKNIRINHEELLNEFIDNINNDIIKFAENNDIYIKDIELIFKDYIFNIKYVQECDWIIETNAPIEIFNVLASILYNFIFI